MSRTLYGHMKSSNVMKVVWLLEELGLDYQRVDIGNVFGGLQSEEYGERNPTRLVPTLIDGDFTLWESNAILRYLCNAYAAHSTFYPSAPQARALVDQWLDCQQTQLTRPQTQVFFQLVRTPVEQRDQAALQQGIEQAGAVWAIIEERLATQPYLCGDHLTIADMAWGVHAHRWLNMDFARPPLPHLNSWYQRLLQHKAFRTHWAGPVI